MENPNYQQIPPPLYVTQSSTLAIVSLIAGILGFTGFPIIASIIALWTGYAARNDTRALPPRATGDGMATAGIVMGWIQIGLAVLTICCLLAYFVFIVGLVSRSGS